MTLAAGACQACPGSYEDLIIPAVAAVLAPSEVGVTASGANAEASRFVLGWSYQLPIDRLARHRIVPSIDLLPGGSVSWRGRLGYRYGRRHVFAGAGVGIDGVGPNVAPEIGVKFGHLTPGDDDIDASLHLLARAEIAPESGHVRGGTILLGWNLY